MPNIVASGGGKVSGSRSKYVSSSKISENEKTIRKLFSDEEDILTYKQADNILSGGLGTPRSNEVIEFILSPDKELYKLLGESSDERQNNFQKIIRKGLKNLWKEMGIENVRYVAGIHLNTQHAHSHILIWNAAQDSETGELKILNKVPRSWFYSNKEENSKIGKLFEEYFNEYSDSTPPTFTPTILASDDIFLPTRETNNERINLVLNSLSEQRYIRPEIVELLTDSGSLYVNSQGSLTFLRRNADSQVSGYINESGKAQIDGQGFFFIGDPNTAKHFVVAENPKEILSLMELTSHRNLADVCFVAADNRKSPAALTELLKVRSNENSLRVIWALNVDKRGQSEDNFNILQNEILSARQEDSDTSLEFYTYAPKTKFGNTWQQQMMWREVPGQVAALVTEVRRVEARNLSQFDAELDNQYDKLAKEVFSRLIVEKDGNEFVVYDAESKIERGRYEWEITPEGNQFSISSINGVRESVHFAPDELILTDEVETLDRIESFSLRLKDEEFLEQIQKEEATAAENKNESADAETVIQTTEDDLSPASEVLTPQEKLDRAKSITTELKRIPLEEVLSANGLGLVRDAERGEWIYKDTGNRFKIKVTGDLWCDRYDDRRGGRNSIELWRHLNNLDFKQARQEMIERFGTEYVPNEKRPPNIVIENAEIKERKPLVLPPPNQHNLEIIRSYLIDERGISKATIDRLIEEGIIYANSFRSVVFLHKNIADKTITGASWRATTGTKRQDVAGSDKNKGWFHLGDFNTAKRIVITESPIEAISYYELHKEGDLSETIILASSGNNVPLNLIRLIEERIGQDAEIVMAFNNDEGGIRGYYNALEKMDKFVLLRHKRAYEAGEIETVEFSGTITQHSPDLDDWNEDLKQTREESAAAVELEHIVEAIDQNAEQFLIKIEAATDEKKHQLYLDEAFAEKLDFVVDSINKGFFADYKEAATTGELASIEDLNIARENDGSAVLMITEEHIAGVEKAVAAERRLIETNDLNLAEKYGSGIEVFLRRANKDYNVNLDDRGIGNRTTYTIESIANGDVYFLSAPLDIESNWTVGINRRVEDKTPPLDYSFDAETFQGNLRDSLSYVREQDSVILDAIGLEDLTDKLIADELKLNSSNENSLNARAASSIASMRSEAIPIARQTVIDALKEKGYAGAIETEIGELNKAAPPLLTFNRKEDELVIEIGKLAVEEDLTFTFLEKTYNGFYDLHQPLKLSEIAGKIIDAYELQILSVPSSQLPEKPIGATPEAGAVSELLSPESLIKNQLVSVLPEEAQPFNVLPQNDAAGFVIIDAKNNRLFGLIEEEGGFVTLTTEKDDSGAFTATGGEIFPDFESLSERFVSLLKNSELKDEQAVAVEQESNAVNVKEVFLQARSEPIAREFAEELSRGKGFIAAEVLPPLISDQWQIRTLFALDATRYGKTEIALDLVPSLTEKTVGADEIKAMPVRPNSVSILESALSEYVSEFNERYPGIAVSYGYIGNISETYNTDDRVFKIFTKVEVEGAGRFQSATFGAYSNFAELAEDVLNDAEFEKWLSELEISEFNTPKIKEDVEKFKNDCAKKDFEYSLVTNLPKIAVTEAGIEAKSETTERQQSVSAPENSDLKKLLDILPSEIMPLFDATEGFATLENQYFANPIEIYKRENQIELGFDLTADDVSGLTTSGSVGFTFTKDEDGNYRISSADILYANSDDPTNDACHFDFYPYPKDAAKAFNDFWLEQMNHESFATDSRVIETNVQAVAAACVRKYEPVEINGKKFTTEEKEFITRADLKAGHSSDKFYLFGDNTEQTGLGGQAAEMRGQPNAIGIPTKKSPSMKEDAFFRDSEITQNRREIDKALAQFAYLPKQSTIVVPTAGLGTGMAKMPETAPLTLEYLRGKLDRITDDKLLLRYTDKQFSEFVPIDFTDEYKSDFNLLLEPGTTKIYAEDKELYSREVFRYALDFYNSNLGKYTNEEIEEFIKTTFDVVKPNWETHFLKILHDEIEVEAQIRNNPEAAALRELKLSFQSVFQNAANTDITAESIGLPKESKIVVIGYNEAQSVIIYRFEAGQNKFGIASLGADLETYSHGIYETDDFLNVQRGFMYQHERIAELVFEKKSDAVELNLEEIIEIAENVGLSLPPVEKGLYEEKMSGRPDYEPLEDNFSAEEVRDDYLRETMGLATQIRNLESILSTIPKTKKQEADQKKAEGKLEQAISELPFNVYQTGEYFGKASENYLKAHLKELGFTFDEEYNLKNESRVEREIAIESIQPPLIDNSESVLAATSRLAEFQHNRNETDEFTYPATEIRRVSISLPEKIKPFVNVAALVAFPDATGTDAHIGYRVNIGGEIYQFLPNSMEVAERRGSIALGEAANNIREILELKWRSIGSPIYEENAFKTEEVTTAMAVAFALDSVEKFARATGERYDFEPSFSVNRKLSDEKQIVLDLWKEKTADLEEKFADLTRIFPKSPNNPEQFGINGNARMILTELIYTGQIQINAENDKGFFIKTGNPLVERNYDNYENAKSAISEKLPETGNDSAIITESNSLEEEESVAEVKLKNSNQPEIIENIEKPENITLLENEIIWKSRPVNLNVIANIEDKAGRAKSYNLYQELHAASAQLLNEIQKANGGTLPTELSDEIKTNEKLQVEMKRVYNLYHFVGSKCSEDEVIGVAKQFTYQEIVPVKTPSSVIPTSKDNVSPEKRKGTPLEVIAGANNAELTKTSSKAQAAEIIEATESSAENTALADNNQKIKQSNSRGLLIPDVVDLNSQEERENYAQAKDLLEARGYQTVLLSEDKVAIKSIPNDADLREYRDEFIYFLNNPSALIESDDTIDGEIVFEDETEPISIETALAAWYKPQIQTAEFGREDGDEQQAYQNASQDYSRNYRLDNAAIHNASPLQRLRWNIEAIELVKELRRDYRAPEKEEQDVLARFSGWGSMKPVFDPTLEDSTKWQTEREALKRILSESEYKAAESATLNSHFTSPTVVDALWATAVKLGFKGGKVIEPSAGIGVVLGRVPEHLVPFTNFTAVEKDDLTAHLLESLYLDANVKHSGYEDHRVPDGWYDLAIGNVPFGSYHVHDERYNKLNAYIHDYFLIKSLDQVRGGGVQILITSAGTLDKADDTIRRRLAHEGKLLGAMRLPSGAFKDNAGTEVVTDVLIIQKKTTEERLKDLHDAEGLELATAELTVAQKRFRELNKIIAKAEKQDQPERQAAAELELLTVQANIATAENKIASERANLELLYPNWLRLGKAKSSSGDEIEINQYFVENPEMIIGNLKLDRGLYHENEMVVEMTDDFPQRILDAIATLPEGVIPDRTEIIDETLLDRIVRDERVKNGSIKIESGRMYRAEKQGFGELVYVELIDVKPATIVRTERMLKIRDAVRSCFNADLQGAPPITTEIIRGHLNTHYDEFVRDYGSLHLPANQKLLDNDPDLSLLLALENYDKVAKTATKAAVFTESTITAYVPPSKADNISEAVGITLNEYGKIHLPRVAFLLKQDGENTSQAFARIEKEFIETGIVFHDPEKDEWIVRDEYLAGNVREKHEAAAIAAEENPARYQKAAEELYKVIPVDLDYTEIDVELGVTWLESGDVQEFVAQMVSGEPEDFKTTYTPRSGSWTIGYSAQGMRHSYTPMTTEILGTNRMNMIEIVQHMLDGRRIAIYDEIRVGESKKQIINVEQTDAANGKARDIQENFLDWVWSDDARRTRLHRKYNDLFNSTLPVKYDGSHLTFPGMAKEINGKPFELRQNQLDAIWRSIRTGSVLFQHEAGGGKTYLMIASAVKMKQLGLVNKPAIAALKANVQDITKDANDLYPGMRLLSTDAQFDTKSRKETVSRIGTNNFDLVIMTHDHLDRLPMKPETRARHINEQLAELRSIIIQSSSEKKQNRLMSRLKTAEENLETRLKDVLTKTKDESYFEETGIDALFVDELHYYKALPVYSMNTDIKGIPTSTSDRAMNMFARAHYLQEKSGGRNFFGATGTSITNTVAELHIWQKFFQRDKLENKGIENFDAWMHQFARTVTKLERTATGAYKQVTRLAEFTNVPELVSLTGEFMDIYNIPEDGAFKRPKLEFEIIKTDLSSDQREYIKDLQKRAENLKRGERDNMLAISTDARKLSLDERLVMSYTEDRPDSKVNLLVDKVLQYHREETWRTQMIFAEMGVHDVVFPDIINKLIANGIPKEKILNFPTLTDVQRKTAIHRLKSGEALVALGSTKTLGTGVNAQDKLYAIHNLDTHWIPAYDEQRRKRMVRDGNEHYHLGVPVKSVYYLTEGGFDEIMYQANARKDAFIKTIINAEGDPSKVSFRRMKEVDGEELSYEEIAAVASGNPLILQQLELQREVEELGRADKRHRAAQLRLKDDLRLMGDKIAANHSKIDGLKTDYAVYENHTAEQEKFAEENKSSNQKLKSDYNEWRVGQRELVEKGEVEKETFAAESLERDKFVKESQLPESSFVAAIGGKTVKSRADAAGELKNTLPRVMSPGKIGEYKGFALEAQISRWFDESRMNLGMKGASGLQYEISYTTEEGVFQSMESVMRSIPRAVEKFEDEIKVSESNISKIESEIGKPFKFKERLLAAQKEFDEINFEIEIYSLSDDEKNTKRAEREGRVIEEKPKVDASEIISVEEGLEIVESSEKARQADKENETAGGTALKAEPNTEEFEDRAKYLEDKGARLDEIYSATARNLNALLTEKGYNEIEANPMIVRSEDSVDGWINVVRYDYVQTQKNVVGRITEGTDWYSYVIGDQENEVYNLDTLADGVIEETNSLVNAAKAQNTTLEKLLEKLNEKNREQLPENSVDKIGEQLPESIAGVQNKETIIDDQKQAIADAPENPVQAAEKILKADVWEDSEIETKDSKEYLDHYLNQGYKTLITHLDNEGTPSYSLRNSAERKEIGVNLNGTTEAALQYLEAFVDEKRYTTPASREIKQKLDGSYAQLDKLNEQIIPEALKGIANQARDFEKPEDFAQALFKKPPVLIKSGLGETELSATVAVSGAVKSHGFDNLAEFWRKANESKVTAEINGKIKTYETLLTEERENIRQNYGGSLAKIDDTDPFAGKLNSIENKPLSHYWWMVEASGDGQGRVFLKAGSYELIRQTYKKLNIDKPNFIGMFNDPETVERMVEHFDKLAIDKPDYANTIKRVSATIGKASQEANGTVIFIADKTAIAHEDFHAASFIASRGESLEARHARFDELVESPIYAKAKPTLVKDHLTDNDGLCVEELANDFAEKNHQKYNVTDDERKEYLKLWFTSFAEKNGTLTKEQFKELNDESKRIRNEAYAAVAVEEVSRHLHTDAQKTAVVRNSSETGNEQQSDGRIDAELSGRDARRDVGRGETIDDLQNEANQKRFAANLHALAKTADAPEQVNVAELLYKEAGEKLEKAHIFVTEEMPSAEDESESLGMEAYEAEMKTFGFEMQHAGGEPEMYLPTSLPTVFINPDKEIVVIKEREEYSYEYAVEGDGAIERSQNYDSMEAAEESRSKFDGWTGAVNQVKELVVYPAADDDLLAIYNANRIDVTVEVQSEEEEISFNGKFQKLKAQYQENLGVSDSDEKLSEEVLLKIQTPLKTVENEELSNFMAQEITLRHEIRETEYQLKEWQKDKQFQRIEVNRGEKGDEKAKVSLADLDKEARQLAKFAVKKIDQTGLLEMKAHEENKKIGEIRRELFAENYEIEINKQKSDREQIESVQSNYSNNKQLLIATKEAKWIDVSKQVAAGKAAMGDDAKYLNPSLKPEVIWRTQEKAGFRQDEEGFFEMEALHRENQIPRSQEALGRLRGVGQMTDITARVEKQALDKFTERFEEESVTVRIKSRNGKIEVTEMSRKEADEHTEYAKKTATELRNQSSDAGMQAAKSLLSPFETKLNPFSSVQGSLSWFTSPVQTLNNHINPLQIIKNDPGVQIVRAVYNCAKYSYKAFELNSNAADKLNLAKELQESVKPQISEQLNELAKARSETIEVTEKISQRVKDALRWESEIRAKEAALDGDIAKNLEVPLKNMPTKDWIKFGDKAVELKDAELLKEFQAEMMNDGELARVVGETEARIVARSIKADVQLAETARDAITSIKQIGTDEIEIELKLTNLAKFGEAERVAELAGSTIEELGIANVAPSFTMQEEVLLRQTMTELDVLTANTLNRLINNPQSVVENMQPLSEAMQMPQTIQINELSAANQQAFAEGQNLQKALLDMQNSINLQTALEVQTMTVPTAEQALSALISAPPPVGYTISQPVLEMSQVEKQTMQIAADAIAQGRLNDSYTEAQLQTQTEIESAVEATEIAEGESLLEVGLTL